MRSDSKSERNLEILHLYTKEGWTMQAIGDVYGLTRQRVFDIISKLTKPIEANQEGVIK